MTVSIDAEQLRSHAAKVDGVGDQIGEAVAAVNSMDLAGGAFGVLCNFLVAPASVVTLAGASMIRDCEDLMRRTKAQLEAFAQEVEAHDQSVVDQLNKTRR